MKKYTRSDMPPQPKSPTLCPWRGHQPQPYDHRLSALLDRALLLMDVAQDVKAAAEELLIDIHILAEENTKLTAKVARLKADKAKLERDYQRLIDQHNTLIIAIQKAAVGAPADPGPLDKGALTTLLTLVHPDRWSQGQPATELAHELTVYINEMRGRAQA